MQIDVIFDGMSESVSTKKNFDAKETHLKERVLLLRFELVRTENVVTALRLFSVETLIVALEELEDIVDDDGLKIDLFLVIKVLGLELNLRHVDIGICA